MGVNDQLTIDVRRDAGRAVIVLDGELENFVRIALVENDQRLKQAMANLERALIPRQPKGKRPRAAAT